MEIEINKGNFGQRIETFLNNLTKTPVTLLFKLIRKKKITVNNKKTEPGYRLQIGDKILISTNIQPKIIRKNNPNDLKLSEIILEEKEDFYIINKPKGLASQGGINTENNLVKMCENHNEDCRIVHRLDQETTGLMIIAKNIVNARKIGEMFLNQKVKKAYLTVLCGALKNIKTVKNPIENKEAQTIFYPIENKQDFTLCLAIPYTGRKHQIRIHANDINHPLFGEKRYNNCPGKIMLHSLFLQLTNNNQVFQTPIPNEFNKCFNINKNKILEIFLTLKDL